MSKWRKPLKNKKKVDARYFLKRKGRIEPREVVENSVTTREVKKKFS